MSGWPHASESDDSADSIAAVQTLADALSAVLGSHVCERSGRKHRRAFGRVLRGRRPAALPPSPMARGFQPCKCERFAGFGEYLQGANSSQTRNSLVRRALRNS